MTFPHLVILLPGISGSVLARDRRELWGTGAGALARSILTLGDSIRQLEVPAGDQEDDAFDDGIEPTRLVNDLHIIPGLWKIDGYTKVADYTVEALKLARGQNFLEFPYDWRLSNRRAARRLAARAHDALRAWRERSGNAEAKLVFVAHSMGGLVARYFIECLEGWKETEALVTFGTPFRGSLNALGFLCNGYSKGIGPLQLDLSDVLRSMDGVYQLLPSFACVERPGQAGLGYASEIEDVAGLDAHRAAKARAFYDEIEEAAARNRLMPEYTARPYSLHPVVGTFQPTFLSARLADGTVKLLTTRDGKDDGGDGTVPRYSATPHHWSVNQGMFTENIHGSLQNVDAVLQQLRGLLTAKDDEDYREPEIDVVKTLPTLARPALMLDDVYPAHADNELTVEPTRLDGGKRLAAELSDVIGRIVDVENGMEAVTVMFRADVDGRQRGKFKLPAGAYRIEVSAPAAPATVTDTFLVVDRA